MGWQAIICVASQQMLHSIALLRALSDAPQAGMHAMVAADGRRTMSVMDQGGPRPVSRGALYPRDVVRSDEGCAVICAVDGCGKCDASESGEHL